MSIPPLYAMAVSLGFAEPQAITLEDAQSMAEARATGVVVAGANADYADVKLEQARDARLPTAVLSAGVDLWTDAQVIQFIPPEAGVDCTTFPSEMITLCAALSTPITVRDQVTASATAKVIEPLTGQIAIGHAIASAKAGVQAAESGQQVAVSDARYSASDAWFLAEQAEAQAEIVAAQVRSLQGRVDAAHAAYKLGAITRGDVLLVELALAQAQQSVIQVGVMESAAWNRLGVVTGNGGDPLRPSGGHTDAPRKAPDAERLVALALQKRPELAQLRAAGESADEGATVAKLSRMPSINALAVYTHTEGQGLFAEPNTAFVGASLDWTVGRIGSGSNVARLASAQAASVHAQLNGAEAGVRAEVRSRVEALAAAGAAYDVATQSVASAEESLRIQEQRHEAGTATMTELLDAEAALVRARSSQSAALYDARRAEVALAHAVGADPWSE